MSDNQNPITILEFANVSELFAKVSEKIESSEEAAEIFDGEQPTRSTVLSGIIHGLNAEAGRNADEAAFTVTEGPEGFNVIWNTKTEDEWTALIDRRAKEHAIAEMLDRFMDRLLGGR